MPQGMYRGLPITLDKLLFIVEVGGQFDLESDVN